MGMDVYGEAPTEPIGEYFRNNRAWWPPLWSYVCRLAKLDERTAKLGFFNNGMLVDAPTAALIADLLEEELRSGRTAEYAREFEQRIAAFPDEECEYCEGSGIRKDMVVEHGCNVCLGKGTVRPIESEYAFSAENVAEFAAFCRASGGFSIF